MNNRDDLVDKLSRKTKKLENQVNHRTIYNIRNATIRALMKSGVMLDYLLPFIISGIVNNTKYEENPPFHIDQITEVANQETIDTSSGIHKRRVSYDFTYDQKLIEHSTGWIINDDGLYERVATSYRLNDKIDLNDTESILSMTKEELENILTVTNIQTISKSTLTPEDELYTTDAIIVINHMDSEETKIRPETFDENMWNSLGFIIGVAILGYGIDKSKKLLFKTKVRDTLKRYEHLFLYVSKKDWEKRKQLLERQKQDLAILKDIANTIKEDEKPHKLLRKERR